jgi:hypothetical protein
LNYIDEEAEKESEEDIPLPKNFKKYNIDGVPKKSKRRSENPLKSNGNDKREEPYLHGDTSSEVTRGMGEKSLSKRRL